MRKLTAKFTPLLLLTVMLMVIPYSGFTEESTVGVSFDGLWVFNEKASDDTDKQVERAIKEAGGKPPRTGKRGRGRYRGGPPDQALYDHIAYDDVIRIEQDVPEFRFVYPEGFERVFYSDNRSRSISIRDTREDKDYSFAGWEGDKLVVQSRPRDGGWIIETYSLQGEGDILEIQMEMKPTSFLAPIVITRIFNRYTEE